MVMDDGPFPCGRIRTFTSSSDGRSVVSYWPHGSPSSSLPCDAGVPAGFVGVESLQMRGDGHLVPIRRWLEGGAHEALLSDRDLAAMPCTDAGFVAAATAEGLLAPSRGDLLRYDAAGDVRWIDWDAVRRAGAPLLDLVHLLRRVPRAADSLVIKANYSGFHSSLDSRAGALSWNDAGDRELWKSIREWHWVHDDDELL